MDRMTEVEIKKQEERLRRKLITQLESMQYMWCKPHRLTSEKIESLSTLELEREHRLHSTLWVEYKIKPIAPKICLSCKKETGKYENYLLNTNNEMEWYNDECQTCMSENYIEY